MKSMVAHTYPFHCCKQPGLPFVQLNSIKYVSSNKSFSQKSQWAVHATQACSMQKRRICSSTLLQKKTSAYSARKKPKWAVPETVMKTSVLRPRIQCNAGAAELGGPGFGYLEEKPQEGVDEEARISDKKKKKKKKLIIAGVDQDELVDPLMLGDPDSLFVDFNGVQVHHKLADSSTDISTVGPEDTGNGLSEITKQNNPPVGIPAIMLHGFGASVFSWNQVLKPLAKVVGSKVVAFDRPAFGLSSRIQLPGSASDQNEKLPTMNPYSLGFSVATTLSFIDLLQSQKAILIGHSAGCLVAANAYFEAPERVAALILVAPAIVAPLLIGKSLNSNENARQRNQLKDEENPFRKIRLMLSRLWMGVSRLITNMLQEMKAMANNFYRKILSAIFRSRIAIMLVRLIMDKYSREAVRYAWYDSEKVTDHVIQGYTKPLKCKGWERALLEFTLAMITDSASEGKPPLKKRLKDISCPVLVVTGDTDRLVPAWNADRLAKAIPGSKFEVIKNCGHLPQEEKPDEFLAIVQKFLQCAVSTSNQPVLQAAI